MREFDSSKDRKNLRTNRKTSRNYNLLFNKYCSQKSFLTYHHLLSTRISKYASASQIRSRSRVLLAKKFLDSVAPLMRKCDFLKTLHLLSGMLFHIHTKATKGDQQNCSISVQK